MAPKHPPRGRVKATPKSLPTPPISDDNIVFTNQPGPVKSKQQKSNDEPDLPRVDVKKVIGGASWTGKVPVQLLSELCQREKWHKPDYSMRTLPSGRHRSSVTMSKKDPKTNETKTLPQFRLPDSYADIGDEETALEARHFAACYALYRVNSMKNIQMALPPKYRDLWKGAFADMKTEDVKAERAWKYEADPFAAEEKRQEILKAMERREAEKARKAAEPEKISLVLPTRTGSTTPSKPDTRMWARAAKVEMGLKIRQEVEEIVRGTADWNTHNLRIPQVEKQKIVEDLSKSGFRRSHIDEAVAICKDREECLEWLLIHVPEDDLPQWSFPENYSAGVTMASGDLVREGKLKRLAAAGYSADLCFQKLREANGDEMLAASLLQEDLMGNSSDMAISENLVSEWEEELASLEAIYDRKFEKLSSQSCRVMSELKQPTNLSFRFSLPPQGYPSVPAIVCIHADKLPAYIRLSATRQVVTFAQKELLGMPMLFSMVEWLDTHLQAVIANPGSLRQITSHLLEQNGESIPNGSHDRPRHLRPQRRTQLTRKDEALDKIMVQKWKARHDTDAQKKMVKTRKSLPAWNMQEEIVETILNHQCVIISGETGSGKSTQSVQFILDHFIQNHGGSSTKIVCTQPRRISALGLADRVSAERCSDVGDEVGYIIRGDSKVSTNTKITFMTTGVLLRKMQNSGNLRESLADVSHVFIDEVHERNLDTDILLALLRDGLAARPDLKAVLMSATLDAEVFASYFGRGNVGLIHIPGRTHPVEDLYLDDILKLAGKSASVAFEAEDEPRVGKAVQALGMGINYDLIADVVRSIDAKLGPKSGAILIFLPGTMEIDRCITMLARLDNIHALPLHASLTPQEQRRVFPPPPYSKRKVIAATNVAETSITIEDIVAVIDTGRVKETNYDSIDNIVRLTEVWASQAACKQRRGRAGRVQAGTCYKLFTRAVEAKMAPRPEPEIRRVPLEQLCLSVKATGTDRDVAQFLRQTLTPPEEKAIENAMKLLHRTGALEDDQLTALGRHLSLIPADLRCAKLLVFGWIFGCLDSCLTIAAILTVKSPFVSPREKREEAKAARQSFGSKDGDLLLDLVAYNTWAEQERQLPQRVVREWCSDNFMSPNVLRDIRTTRTQLMDSLKDADLVDARIRLGDIKDRISSSDLLRGLIAGALYPQVASIDFPDAKFAASMSGAVALDPEAKMIKYFNEENGRVFVHPSSVTFDAQGFSSGASMVSYFTKMATSKTFVRELTPFNAYSLLMFGGAIELEPTGKGLIIDGWIKLRGWTRIGVLVNRLRTALDAALRRRVDDPNYQGNSDELRVLAIVRKLVELNGQNR